MGSQCPYQVREPLESLFLYKSFTFEKERYIYRERRSVCVCAHKQCFLIASASLAGHFLNLRTSVNYLPLKFKPSGSGESDLLMVQIATWESSQQDSQQKGSSYCQEQMQDDEELRSLQVESL